MTVATEMKVDLDQLRAREGELVEKVEAKRTSLDEYPAKIAEENRNLVYAGKRPLTQLNSPLQKLLDAQKKDATTLTTLEGELSAVRSVIEVEAIRQSEEETAEARVQIAEMHVKEEAIWKQASEAFAEMASVWNKYVSQAEESSKFAHENGLDPSTALAVVPAPLSFRSWLLLLHVASTDPTVHAPPHVQEMFETGNYNGRYETHPAPAKVTEVRRKLDHGDRLFHLIKPLGGVVRALNLSGRIPTITE
jgi:hypothetical protein